MIIDTKVITISCTEIFCSWVLESYVARYLVQLGMAYHRCSNPCKGSNGFQLSLFRSVVLQFGFSMENFVEYTYSLEGCRYIQQYLLYI